MTPNNESQSHFEGWAIVEVFGHQRYAGNVATQVFGQAVMWRVDVPEIPERETTLKQSLWVEEDGGGRVAPVGSVVKAPAIDGYTKLFGTGAIYAVTPCTEEAARAAVVSMTDRLPLKLVKLPEESGEQQALPEAFSDCGVDLGEDPDLDAEEVPL